MHVTIHMDNKGFVFLIRMCCLSFLKGSNQGKQTVNAKLFSRQY